MKLIMRKMQSAIVVACSLIAGVAGAATWTGGGDGFSWYDVNNWGGALPGETEQVEISAPNAGLQIQLGASSQTIGNLRTLGSGKVTISGSGELAIQNLYNGVDADLDVPVTFKNGDNIIEQADRKVLNFLQPVTSLGDNKKITVKAVQEGGSAVSKTVNFRSTFTGAGTKFHMAFGSTGSTTDTSVHFYGKTVINYLSCADEGYRSGWCYLHSSSNEIAKVLVCYGGVVLDAKDALPETTPLEWGTYYNEEGLKLFSYNFTGRDQLAEAIRSPHTLDNRNIIRSRRLISLSGPTTLTLKGRSDAIANCVVADGMSLVWDPVGDYTQEVFFVPSTTDGSITVKRGTFKIGSGGSFSNLTSVVIGEGATFDIATDIPSAMKHLVSANIASGGKLRIASSAVTAFSNEDANMILADGATIEANSDATLYSLVYKGEAVAAGTYGAGATEAPWVTGSAQIKVLGGEGMSKEKRTWTGLGDGCTWSDNANWDTCAPTSMDSIYFPIAATITSDIELIKYVKTIDVAEGISVKISGNISGSSDIIKIGRGTLTLSGNNSFTGSLYIKSGIVVASGENSLSSSGDGEIEVYKENDTYVYNLMLSGVTIRKNLVVKNVNDGSNKSAQSVRCAQGTVNTIEGKLIVPNSYFRLNLQKNAKLIIAGGAEITGAFITQRAEGSEIIVRNVGMKYVFYHDNQSDGKLVFDCEGNKIEMGNFSYSRGSHQLIETRVNGALTADTFFLMGINNNSGISVLDLCGTTQTISRIEALVQNGVVTAPATIRSELPAKITFSGNNTYTNSCIFEGDVTFEKAGTGDVRLTTNSSSSGDLIVSGGRVVFEEGAMWQGGIVFNGGQIVLPEGEYLVKRLTDESGNPLPGGRYASREMSGATKLSSLSGDGVLVVMNSGVKAQYVWTGNGGDNNRFSESSNWENGELPDFSNPLGEYYFPGNDFTAVVDVEVTAKEMVFSSQAAGTVSIDALGYDAKLMLSEGSLVVTGAVGVAKSVVIGAPLKCINDVSLRAGMNDDKTTDVHQLIITNKISGISALHKDGYGTLTIDGNDNDLAGDMVVSNGLVKLVGDNPLGGSGTFYLYAPDNCQKTKVRLCGATIMRPMTISHVKDSNSYLLYSAAGTTNYFKAIVSGIGAHLRVNCENKSVIRFQGGISTSAFFIPSSSADGIAKVFIDDVPANSGSMYWSDISDDKNCTVMTCAGNRFDGGWNLYNTLDLQVDYAMYENSKLNFNFRNVGEVCGLILLNGTKQEISMCARQGVKTNEQGVVQWVSQGRISGDEGSELKLNGADAVENLPVFMGSASYVHSGTATRKFRDPNTSVGDLTVVAGKLVMSAPREEMFGFDQSNCANAVLKGGTWSGLRVSVIGGELAVNHSGAFEKKVELYLNGAQGKISIPAGVDVNCSYIYVDGVRKPVGTYDASNFASHITGGGRIVSKGNNLGTVLIFR